MAHGFRKGFFLELTGPASGGLFVFPLPSNTPAGMQGNAIRVKRPALRFGRGGDLREGCLVLGKFNPYMMVVEAPRRVRGDARNTSGIHEIDPTIVHVPISHSASAHGMMHMTRKNGSNALAPSNGIIQGLAGIGISEVPHFRPKVATEYTESVGAETGGTVVSEEDYIPLATVDDPHDLACGVIECVHAECHGKIGTKGKRRSADGMRTKANDVERTDPVERISPEDDGAQCLGQLPHSNRLAFAGFSDQSFVVKDLTQVLSTCCGIMVAGDHEGRLAKLSQVSRNVQCMFVKPAGKITADQDQVIVRPIEVARIKGAPACVNITDEGNAERKAAVAHAGSALLKLKVTQNVFSEHIKLQVHASSRLPVSGVG